jgi:hypothetical protein
LLQPSWKYVLNYETKWLSREEIVDVTYEAIGRLTELKAKYGQISRVLAEGQIARIEQSRRLEEKIDRIVKTGRAEDLQLLKPEIDRVNGFSAVQHRQLIDVPLGLLRLRYVNALWGLITRKS